MSQEHLTLEYMLSKGLTLSEAALVLEAVCSCSIENPKCENKKTVDKVIEIIKSKRK